MTSTVVDNLLNSTVNSSVDSFNTSTTTAPSDRDRAITWDDATWILTSSFVIFTMQSGFGLLEAGVVSGKNEVNIMVKNAVDVIFGGLTFWMFGYGLSFGDDPGSNPFCGVGHFFVDIEDGHDDMGFTYANYIFQLSFATTATTIVSGAMAERTKLIAYIVFSFFNTIVYCMPAHWIWGHNGFLKQLGALDIAGAGPVHLVGGVSALVAALLLKPRHGRYENGGKPPPLGNPTNCLVGMFMLWWGWLGFNCGSTFGISGGKWKLAAKSAVTTVNASMAGGSIGLVYSYIVNKRKFMIPDLVNSVLGSLVAVTASCAIIRPWEAILLGLIAAPTVCTGQRLLDFLHVDDPVGAIAVHGIGAACALIRPWEALIIGALGALASLGGSVAMDRLKIDDPVGAIAVHGFGGIWGLIAVGFFANIDPLEDTTSGQRGVFHGGGWRLLGVQLLAVVCIFTWSALISFLLLFTIDKTIGLRMSEEDELLGTDFVEHGIGQETDLLLVENASNAPNSADVDESPRTVSVRRKSAGGFSFQRTYRIHERRQTRSGFANHDHSSLPRLYSSPDAEATTAETNLEVHMNGGTHIGASTPTSNGVGKKYENKYGAEYSNSAFVHGEEDQDGSNSINVRF